MELQDIMNLVQDKITNHYSKQSKYKEAERIYNGGFNILNKQRKKTEKANSKLVHNFVKVIIRNSNAYFLGEKVSFNYPNPVVNKVLQEIIKESNLNNYLIELATNTSKFTLAYLLTYIDSNNNLKFIPLHPSNVILHKNVFGQSMYAIILAEEYDFIRDKTDKYITYYTKEMICEFVIREDYGKMEVLDIRPNKLGKIPVVEFKNNTAGTNEIDDVIGLIDAYNLIQSNRLDDNIELRHSILHINNVNPDTNFFENLSDYNLMVTKDGNNEKKAEIKYLTKSPDTGAEVLLERINRDIFTIAGIPDFSNMDFTGGDTIIAIRSKLYPLMSKTKEKEELFISSFRYMFSLIEKYISIKYSVNFNAKDVEITFVRPNFTNIGEELDNAKKLKDLGIVSDDTILNSISIIKDVEEEKEKYAKQIDNTEKIEEKDINIDYFSN